MGFGFFEGFMFNIFPIIFLIMFVSIFGIFIFTFVKSAKQWNKNNNSPVLTVDAKIVSKRTDIRRHNHSTNDNMHHHSTSSTYYVTFEVESNDRFELAVAGNEYGLLVEGDSGKLTFQGTRYKGFQRK